MYFREIQKDDLNSYMPGPTGIEDSYKKQEQTKFSPVQKTVLMLAYQNLVSKYPVGNKFLINVENPDHTTKAQKEELLNILALGAAIIKEKDPNFFKNYIKETRDSIIDLLK